MGERQLAVANLTSNGLLRKIDLGVVTTSQAPSVAENLLQRLESDDIVTTAPSAARLSRWWPAGMDAWPVRRVRDAFFQSPDLPRLRQPDSIQRTIATGVARGDIGLARRRGDGSLELVKFNEPIEEGDIELTDEAVILKPDEARKLIEPPRLKEISIEPANCEVRPSERITFRATGRSQHQTPIEPERVEWTASGGTITAGGASGELGEFVAGDEAGYFVVNAAVGVVQGATHVRVVRQPTAARADAPATGPQLLLWEGDVPPQKWMNFYTRVLSRFASSPGLKLRVSFEVAGNDPSAAGGAEEVRAALRDLGLHDDISRK